MIDDGDVDQVVAGVASEGAPSAACGPDGSALDAFAGEVFAGGGVVRAAGGGCRDLGKVPVGVGEDAAFFIGRFKPARDAEAEDAFLVVAEDDFVESFQGD